MRKPPQRVRRKSGCGTRAAVFAGTPTDRVTHFTGRLAEVDVDGLPALRPASVARCFFRAALSLRPVRVAEELDDESLLERPEARLD
jgi:hypothetical protein